MILLQTYRAARQFCVGVAPDTPSDTAVYAVANAADSVIGYYLTTAPGQNCSAVFSGKRITHLYFSGYANHFARF